MISMASPSYPIDIEARGTTWLGQVYTALEKDDDQYDLECFIWKVPDHHRLDPKHFEPSMWRFGLHNRFNHQMEGFGVTECETERFKVSIARVLALTRAQWVDFCCDVVPDPVNLQVMYGIRHPLQPFRDESLLRCLLTFDALFLVTYLHYHGCIQQELEYNFKPSFKDVLGSNLFTSYDHPIWYDVCLMENQVPMKLMVHVIDKLRGINDCDENMKIPKVDKQFWRETLFVLAMEGFYDKSQPGYSQLFGEHFFSFQVECLTTGDLSTRAHILDIVYHIICESTTDCDSVEDYRHIPSATQLQKSGVVIKGESRRGVGTISFEKGCLTIPYVALYDATETKFRNLALYEMLVKKKSPTFRYYTLIMGDLLRNNDDVLLLVECGVIENGLDNKADAAAVWKHINQNVVAPRITKEMLKTLQSINKHSRSKRHRYWYEFRKLFCSRPWFVLSVISVTLIMLGTLIQVYTNVISSNGMRPQFLHP